LGYVATFADLLSAVFGILGAVILAAPLFGEITDRRHWQRLVQFTSRATHNEHAVPKSPTEIEAERKLRDQLIDERMGEYHTYRFSAFFGSACLLIAFIFLGIAAIDRALSNPCTHSCS